MTPHEAKLWVALRKLRPAGHHFRRQVAVGSFIVDFVCLKERLIVEVDGAHHGIGDHVARNVDRHHTLIAHGFQVLRFRNSDIDRDLRSVMDTIVSRLDARGPTPGGPGGPTRPSPPGRENARLIAAEHP